MVKSKDPRTFKLPRGRPTVKTPACKMPELLPLNRLPLLETLASQYQLPNNSINFVLKPCLYWVNTMFQVLGHGFQMLSKKRAKMGDEKAKWHHERQSYPNERPVLSETQHPEYQWTELRLIQAWRRTVSGADVNKPPSPCAALYSHAPNEFLDLDQLAADI